MAQRVTSDMLSDWDAHKSSIEAAIKSPLDGPTGTEVEERRSLLRDLCWHVVMTGRPTVDQAAEALALASTSHGFHTALTDVLWLLTIEVEGEDSPERKRLVDLIRRVHTGGVVPGVVLKERLDVNIMAKAGLISGYKLFLQRAVRMNTREFLVQQKFNLLREESEGYSKLVTELTRSELSEANVDSVIGTIQSLVGYFDLDPNRVLDLVLEAYEHNQENSSYLRIVACFPRSSLAHLTGFKFKYQYSASEDPKLRAQQQQQPVSPPSSSLYFLAARLIKHKFITIEDLYPHLLPDDGLAAEDYAKRFEKTPAPVPAPGAGILGVSPSSGPSTGLSLRGLDDDTPIAPLAPASSSTTTTTTIDNQKLGLLAALLAINDWDNAEGLLYRLSKIDPASHPPITRALCERLHRMLEPVYATVRHAPPRRPLASTTGAGEALAEEDLVRDWKSLGRVLCPVLLRLGLHISADIVLFTKVCRVLKEYVKVGNAGGDVPKEEAIAVTERIIIKVLLPALAVAGSNPALSHEVWDVLKLFPYRTRYDAYARWRFSYARHPVLAAAKAEAAGEARKILRRISKDNVKQLGRQLGKASHANPAIVLETVVSQVCSYDNLIAPVVDALKYLTSLSYDVLSYTIVDQLASGSRAKLKSDGTSEAHWLQGLATFTGALYRKYPASLELHGLLEHLTSQLASGSSLELIIFREVMARMAGIEGGEGSLSDTQVQALAGSELLKQESSPIPMARNLKKPSNRLREALLGSHLAAPLLILIAQQRGLILYSHKAEHLKLLGDLYDKCQETLIQYTEFLQTNVTPPAKYASLFPSFRELVTRYNLDPESVFGILRPVLPLLFPADDAEKEKAVGPSEALVSCVRDVFPDRWESLSPQLYATFWSLSLYDIEVPAERYRTEIVKLRESLKALSDEIARDPATAPVQKKERERVQAVVQKLEEDFEKQKANYEAVMRRLEREKALWFPINNPQSTATSLVAALTKTCILPRALHSMTDAIYCARFVQLLQKLDTPNFSTLQYYNSVLAQVVLGIFCCTEGEAVRLGRFLRETIATLESWRCNRDIYLREGSSKRGMAASFSDTSKRVSFDQFPRILYKWYFQTTKAFTDCLDAGEYMQVKNALLVLTRINDVYPTLRRAHENLEKRVLRLVETEKREDLKLLAQRYSALLGQKKLPENEGKLLSEEEFLGARLAARVLAKDKEKEKEKEVRPSGSKDSKESIAPVVSSASASSASGAKDRKTEATPASTAEASTPTKASSSRMSATSPPYEPAKMAILPKLEPRERSASSESRAVDEKDGGTTAAASTTAASLKSRLEEGRISRQRESADRSPATTAAAAAVTSHAAPLRDESGVRSERDRTEAREPSGRAEPAAAAATTTRERTEPTRDADRERERERESRDATATTAKDRSATTAEAADAASADRAKRRRVAATASPTLPPVVAVKKEERERESPSAPRNGGDESGSARSLDASKIKREPSDDSVDKSRKRRSDRDAREPSSSSTSAGGSAAAGLTKDDTERKETKRRRTTPDGAGEPSSSSSSSKASEKEVSPTKRELDRGERESRSSTSSSSASSTLSKTREEPSDGKRRRVASRKDEPSSSSSSSSSRPSSSSSVPAPSSSSSSSASSSRESEKEREAAPPQRNFRGRGEIKARDERRDERRSEKPRRK